MRAVSQPRYLSRFAVVTTAAGFAWLGHSAPRCAATTNYVVNSLADTFASDGKITLREALQAANTDTAILDAPAGSGRDNIQFDPNLFAGGSATLSMAGTEFQITSGVDITGPGRDAFTIDAQTFSRIFDSSSSSATVNISGMTLRNGRINLASGGGQVGSGGSVFNAGTMALNDMKITDSRANSQIIGDDNTQYGGGAIYNYRGSLTVQNSIIQNCTTNVKGGAIESTRGNVVLQNSTLTNNNAQFDGDSIGAHDGTLLTLDHTSVDTTIDTQFFNTSSRKSKLTVLNNSNLATVLAFGNTNVTDSTIADITVYETGAIADSHIGKVTTSDYIAGANLDVTRSTVKQIVQGYGNVTVTRSTLTGGASGQRALTSTQSNGTTVLENVTVTGFNSTQDGTLFFANGNLATIRNSTIAGNQAGRGGGVFVSTGTLSLISSIVANNTATVLSNDFSGFASGDHNLVEDPTGAFIITPGNLFSIDPALAAALADNGGPTLTLALLNGSPAIDGGSNPVLLLVDQRGFARVVGLGPDIGAFEVPEPGGLLAVGIAGIALARRRRNTPSTRQSNPRPA